MRTISKLSLLLLLVAGQLHAQDTPFDEDHFPDKAALRTAISELQTGDQFFEMGGFHYVLALPHYIKAQAFNPNNSELNLKLGLCHLNSEHRAKALPYFEKANALAAGIPRIHFLLGYAYQLNNRWDEAIAAYEEHLQKTGRRVDEVDFYNTADKRLIECRSGKALMAEPTDVTVELLGAPVSTEFAEYGAVISPDGRELYFTGRRPNTTGGKMDKRTNDHFEDIYVSRMKDGQWGAPEQLPAPVNSANNDATIGLFNDGRTLLMFRDRKGTGDIFETRYSGGEWSAPKPMGPNVNTEFHESSAWFSFDKQWIYFVSDRPDGSQGGQDVYRAAWDAAANDWGPAQNLGPTINSPYDEEGIFVHPDGKTIYFSSTGHNSMGGYDIFRSQWVDGSWSEPRNMGYPVNSSDDDVFFVVTADGTTGFFSSIRQDGLGLDDLYKVELRPGRMNSRNDMADIEGGIPEGVDQPVLSENGTVLIKGAIHEWKTMLPLSAGIELLDLEDGSLLAKFDTDPSDGSYQFAVPSADGYVMNISSKGYLFGSEHIELPVGKTFMEFDHDITLKPLETGSEVVLKNIFFNTNEAVLAPTSIGELEQVLKLLRQNPDLRIEVSGHTDSNGADDHNMKLSDARANSVVDHLVRKGINASRLVAKGYGETQPLHDNSSEEGRALNRRTEIAILGN